MAWEGTFNFQERPQRCFIEGSLSNYSQIRCQTHLSNSRAKTTMCISAWKVVGSDNQIMNITAVNLRQKLHSCLPEIWNANYFVDLLKLSILFNALSWYCWDNSSFASWPLSDAWICFDEDDFGWKKLNTMYFHVTMYFRKDNEEEQSSAVKCVTSVLMDQSLWWDWPPRECQMSQCSFES